MHIEAAEQFCGQHIIKKVESFGSGNINTTFLVSLVSTEAKFFVLQRINSQVFDRPELIMANIITYNRHARQRLELSPLPDNRQWQVPEILIAQNGNNHWRAHDGSFWRALSFIENTHSYDTITNMEHAYEVGAALAIFHSIVNDLPVEKLADTLKGFHITPSYLYHYDRILSGQTVISSPEQKHCQQFIDKRRPFVTVLEQAKAKGELQLRPIHGDPKINNILLDSGTGLARSMIDLDTIKPGLIHYDIGDCLRSGCNTLGEETEQWQSVRFDTDLCRTILNGYLAISKDLSAKDVTYIYDAIRLISFELGLRYYTDYLQGNIYFRTTHPDHNLHRALIQFQLTESIESQAGSIQAIISDLK